MLGWAGCCCVSIPWPGPPFWPLHAPAPHPPAHLPSTSTIPALTTPHLNPPPPPCPQLPQPQFKVLVSSGGHFITSAPTSTSSARPAGAAASYAGGETRLVSETLKFNVFDGTGRCINMHVLR